MEKEIDIFQMYLDEMSAIAGCDQAENARLVSLAMEGDDGARGRLIEGNLKYVLGISRDYIGRGMPVDDLVQEANMALMLAVEELAAMEEDSFERFVEKRVRQMIGLAVEQQEAEDRTGKMMAEKVNLMQDVSRDMAEELGREPKVEELAQRLQMTDDEVRDIMKMALDAINVEKE